MKKISLIGVFAAVTAICSWINIPLFFTPVPVNLALIGPYAAGCLLGSRSGFLSQIVYIMLGLIGIPVFAGFTGGAAVLAGPTGGFIAGYAVCALICGAYSRRGLRFRGLSDLSRAAAFMTAGLLACYGLGLLWYMAVTGSSLWSGLIACVLPFLPGDAVKIACAVLLCRRLWPVVSSFTAES